MDAPGARNPQAVLFACGLNSVRSPMAESLLRQMFPQALAVVAKNRLPILPDVPTVIEAGLPASSVIAPWYGVMARAGTPAPLIARWNAEINAALKSPQVLAKMRDLGAIVTGGSVAEYGQTLEEEKLHWAKLFKERGIQPE